MSWQAASLVVLALALIAGFGWYERDRPPARILALVATMAALAVVGRARLCRDPERQADNRHRAVRRLRARRGAGLCRGGGDCGRVERLPLSGSLDPVADGRLGGRRGGRRRACARHARPRAQSACARRRLRARRPRLRRLDGPLPAHPRGPPGPRHLPGAVRELAPVQPRPCDRKRRVLPLDWSRIHPRASPLPPQARSALARARGRGRSDAAAGPRPGSAGRRGRRVAGGAAPNAGLREPRTRTAASARSRASPPARCSAAGPGSGWPRRATTRATCAARAGDRWRPTSHAAGPRSRT